MIDPHLNIVKWHQNSTSSNNSILMLDKIYYRLLDEADVRLVSITNFKLIEVSPQSSQ